MDKAYERSLINFLYYDLNRLRFFIHDEIFEYDIQSSIHIFLKHLYKDKNIEIKREKGKTDHVIQVNDSGGKLIKTTLIEVKSFIKKSEKLNYTKIFDDIEKLNIKVQPETEGYLIIVIKESHLNNRSKNLSELIKVFISNKKVHYFIGVKEKIRTRVIRSMQTMYLVADNKLKAHQSQIRVFMFQLNGKTI